MGDIKFKDLKIVFIGAVDEGLQCLRELLALGCHVQAVFTFNDEMAAKTSGAASFDEVTARSNIPLYKIQTANSPDVIEKIRELQPDAIFVLGWTRLVSKEILAIPKHGCFGMHASLLPKYRGRAPVNWVIINGERQTGNSTMLLDEGTDTGKVVTQREIRISMADTCKTLYGKVALAGRDMIREILPKLASNALVALPQDENLATVMPKRTPDDGVIDWNKSALQLFNWVRALTHPYPGAFTKFRGRKLLIWEARIGHFTSNNEHIETADLTPGTVVSVSDGIVVSTGGNELLSLHRLNYDLDDEREWRAFLAESPLQPGDRLTAD
jgi:methionyl-tRNA formyltransferase